MYHDNRQPWMRRAGDYPTTDTEYFELLTRAVMSAGLGPRVVEVRWGGIREAFFSFDIETIAQMSSDDLVYLMCNSAVIRNRRKLDATIENAKTFLALSEENGSFKKALLTFTDIAPLTPDRFQYVAGIVSRTFEHLGLTSAGLFLFSCGFRTVQE